MEFKYAKDAFIRAQEKAGMNRPVVQVFTHPSQHDPAEIILGQFCGIVGEEGSILAKIEIMATSDIRRIDVSMIKEIYYVPVSSLIEVIDNMRIAAETISRVIREIAFKS